MTQVLDVRKTTPAASRPHRPHNSPTASRRSATNGSANLPVRAAITNGQPAADHMNLPAQPKPLADALRVGLVGVGRGAVTMLQRDLLPQPVARIVACTDLLPDRAASLARALGARPAKNFAAILADPQVELVVISTRSHEHASMAAQALRAGKHVLVEKPIARNLAETDKLLALAKKLAKPAANRRAKSTKQPGPQLFVRHNRRFDAPFQLARAVIQSGKIGDLFAFSIRIHNFNRRNDWQTLNRFGGGQLLNWGSHVIDWALQLLDAPIADLWADTRRVVSGGDAEDHIKLMLRAKNGIVADLEISSGAAISAPGWHLLGTRGSLLIDGQTARLKFVPPDAAAPPKATTITPGQVAAWAKGPGLNWIEESLPIVRQSPETFWGALYKSIRAGVPFPVTLAEVRETMRIIELARAAGAPKKSLRKPKR